MSQAARWRAALIVGGALLGALGWWLPWILPRSGAAALVLLGLDLGDFWKFTNEWRVLGLLRWERLAFFLPPPLAALCLTLWLAGWPRRARWLALPLLLFLCLVILPRFEDVRPALPGNPLAYEHAPDETGPLASLAREFSFQLRLAALSLLGVMLLPLWTRLGRARLALLGGVALVGAMLPPLALWRTWPLVQGLYGGGALLGPGVLLSSLGFTLAAGGAGWSLARLTRR